VLSRERRERIQQVPSLSRSEERTLERREQIRAVLSRQRTRQVPRLSTSEERALGLQERIRQRIQPVPRRSTSEAWVLGRRGRARAAWGLPIKAAWVADEQRSIAETLQGHRIPEPLRSSPRRMPVVRRIRKQGEVSNRRTRTTKTRITDSCPIRSLTFRGLGW
jgi:hypothetical protein